MSAEKPSLARRAAAGVFLLAAAAGLLAACGLSDPAVATVNGDPIRSSELKRQVRVFQSVRPGAMDDEATRRQVLDQLIKQRLLVQMARKAGLDKDAQALAAIAERRMKVRADLEKTIADAQAQLQGLDEAVEARALIEALSQLKRPGMTVTPQDLQAAYRARAAQAPLPPLSQVRDQLLEQVLLDRLVEEARVGAKVELKLEKI